MFQELNKVTGGKPRATRRSSFSPEFGRPKAYIFHSMGVPGRLDALLAKSLGRAKLESLFSNMSEPLRLSYNQTTSYCKN